MEPKRKIPTNAIRTRRVKIDQTSAEKQEEFPKIKMLTLALKVVLIRATKVQQLVLVHAFQLHYFSISMALYNAKIRNCSTLKSENKLLILLNDEEFQKIRGTLARKRR